VNPGLKEGEKKHGRPRALKAKEDLKEIPGEKCIRAGAVSTRVSTSSPISLKSEDENERVIDVGLSAADTRISPRECNF